MPALVGISSLSSLSVVLCATNHHGDAKWKILYGHEGGVHENC